MLITQDYVDSCRFYNFLSLDNPTHDTCGQQSHVSNSEIVLMRRGKKEAANKSWGVGEKTPRCDVDCVSFFIYIVGGVHGQHKEESITVRGSHPMVVGDCSWLEVLFMLDTRATMNRIRFSRKDFAACLSFCFVLFFY